MWLGVLAFLLIVSGLFTIYVAHNHFLHYVQLLVITVGFGMASLLMTNSPDRTVWGSAFLLVFLALNLATQSSPRITPIIGAASSGTHSGILRRCLSMPRSQKHL